MSYHKRLKAITLHSVPTISFRDDIFGYFKILEITVLIQINKFLYNYVVTNDKSINVIKQCISYDFGDILSTNYFDIQYNSAYDLINEVYSLMEDTYFDAAYSFERGEDVDNFFKNLLKIPNIKSSGI